MREIKFRAWDKMNKKMIRPSGIYGNEQYWKIEGSNNHYWGMFKNGKRICGNADESGILMQYTGLTAPGNKEVYSGDIIECYASDGQHISKGVVSFEGCDYIVKYSEGSAKGFYYLHHILVDTITIIGNIFENPELLEGECNEI